MNYLTEVLRERKKRCAGPWRVSRISRKWPQVGSRCQSALATARGQERRVPFGCNVRWQNICFLRCLLLPLASSYLQFKIFSGLIFHYVAVILWKPCFRSLFSRLLSLPECFLASTSCRIWQLKGLQGKVSCESPGKVETLQWISSFIIARKKHASLLHFWRLKTSFTQFYPIHQFLYD